MSKYIDEICADIRHNPQKWRGVPGVNNLYTGLTNGPILIEECGLGGRWAFFTIASMTVNGEAYKLQGRDQARLDRAVLWWWRTQPATSVLPQQVATTFQ